MNNRLIKISIIGFGVAAFFEIGYALNILRIELPQGSSQVLWIGVVLEMFIGFLSSVVAFGLSKRKKWAYKMAIVLAILCLTSLFSKPDKVEILIIISGVLLFLSRKNYFQTNEEKTKN